MKYTIFYMKRVARTKLNRYISCKPQWECICFSKEDCVLGWVLLITSKKQCGECCFKTLLCKQPKIGNGLVRPNRKPSQLAVYSGPGQQRSQVTQRTLPGRPSEGQHCVQEREEDWEWREEGERLRKTFKSLKPTFGESQRGVHFVRVVDVGPAKSISSLWKYIITKRDMESNVHRNIREMAYINR